MVSAWDIVIWVGLLILGILIGYFLATGNFIEASVITDTFKNLTVGNASV